MIQILAVHYAGQMRVSFNRHAAAPLVWSIATDDWELNVKDVRFVGLEVRTAYRAKATPDDEDGRPSAWLECCGELFVRGGVAEITSPEIAERDSQVKQLCGYVMRTLGTEPLRDGVVKVLGDAVAAVESTYPGGVIARSP